MTCSQLSRTMRVRLGWRYSESRSTSTSAVPPGPVASTPRAPATMEATSAASGNRPSSTRTTPSGKSSWTPAATSRARRVFPPPPTPVNVTRRDSSSRPRTSLISLARPTKEVTAAGRVCRRPGERRGGKAEGRPGSATWNTRSARERSARRWSPRSSSATPTGRWSRARSAAACEQSTWPPQPRDRRRAVRLRVGPT